MQTILILLMKEKQITNKAMAEKIGITEKQFGLKLRGKSDFKSTEMFKISRILKKPINEIFLPSMYENGTLDDS